GWNCDDRISSRDQRKHEIEKSEQWSTRRADNADSAKRLVHGDSYISEGWVVDGSVEFVGPGCIGKQSFDAYSYFSFRLLRPDGGGESLRDFRAALGKVFCDVEEHLCAIVSRGLGPAFGFASSFDGIANVFAISERRFAEQLAVCTADLNAVAGIGAR